MDSAPAFHIATRLPSKSMRRALALELLPLAWPLAAAVVISVLSGLAFAVQPLALLTIPFVTLAVVSMALTFMFSGLGWIEMDRRGIGIPLLIVRFIAVTAMYLLALDQFVGSFDCGSDCQDAGALAVLYVLFAVTLAVPALSALILWLTARNRDEM